jgi:hypothetical protein
VFLIYICPISQSCNIFLIFQVHFNSVDIQLVAGRKQCKNAIPCHFCVCPYDKEANKKNKLRKKSTKPFETADHAYCSESPVKKSLPLQLHSSNNTLPHTYIRTQLDFFLNLFFFISLLIIWAYTEMTWYGIFT